jgi:hypothetical protein
LLVLWEFAQIGHDIPGIEHPEAMAMRAMLRVQRLASLNLLRVGTASFRPLPRLIRHERSADRHCDSKGQDG